MTDAVETRSGAIVIGGGPAGAATALTLARAGVSVLLLERGDGTGNPVGECLAPTATPLLHRLGLYEIVLATRPLPSYGNRSVWGGDGAAIERDFIREPDGPGWHLDRPAFNGALLAATTAAGAECRLRSTVVRTEPGRHRRWRLHVDDPAGRRWVEVDVVVDAGGRSSGFARRCGARRLAFDRLAAVATTLRPTTAPLRDATTLVEATERGWWYSALLPDGRLATAFSRDPDLLAAASAWRPEGWRALLAATRETRERIVEHGYEPEAEPRVLAASSSLLAPIAGEGWLATGDAAATYDPLSSHGIASALVAGRQAGGAVAAYLDGDRRALDAYAGRIADGFARYLWMWRAFYAEERRWPAAPFWRRRLAGTDLSSVSDASDASESRAETDRSTGEWDHPVSTGALLPAAPPTSSIETPARIRSRTGS